MKKIKEKVLWLKIMINMEVTTPTTMSTITNKISTTQMVKRLIISVTWVQTTKEEGLAPHPISNRIHCNNLPEVISHKIQDNISIKVNTHLPPSTFRSLSTSL